MSRTYHDSVVEKQRRYLQQAPPLCQLSYSRCCWFVPANGLHRPLQVRDDAAMCTRSTTNDFVVCLFFTVEEEGKKRSKKNKKTTLICIDEIEEVVIYVTKTPYI